MLSIEYVYCVLCHGVSFIRDQHTHTQSHTCTIATYAVIPKVPPIALCIFPWFDGEHKMIITEIGEMYRDHLVYVGDSIINNCGVYRLYICLFIIQLHFCHMQTNIHISTDTWLNP